MSFVDDAVKQGLRFLDDRNSLKLLIYLLMIPKVVTKMTGRPKDQFYLQKGTYTATRTGHEVILSHN